jgi:hypothetical protein
MRLWSISPIYLDPVGLVALWREGLLAQKVLLGQTQGYRFHPQLMRFRACSDQALAIGCYLNEIAHEADRRGYRFNNSKIMKFGPCQKIKVTSGQIKYEWQHLLSKLKIRAPVLYETNRIIVSPDIHPLFEIVPGEIEDWERV